LHYAKYNANEIQQINGCLNFGATPLIQFDLSDWSGGILNLLGDKVELQQHRVPHKCTQISSKMPLNNK
jgi:hypothetical protein